MAVAEATRELAIPVRRERSPLADAFHQLLRNKMAVTSGVFIIIMIVMAIFTDNALIAVPLGREVVPLLAPEPFDEVHFRLNNAAPSRQYLLGNDYLGRDMLSRTLYGARVSLAVAFVAAGVSLFIGITYGLASGYFGGRVDEIMMRIVDFLYAFPILIFVILLQVYFKAITRRGGTGFIGTVISLNKAMGGMFFLFIALGALNWLQMARIARGQVLSYKEKEFIEAARMVGAGDMRIIFRHLLPNILGPCIVAETLTIPTYIFWEAFLSFLGLGVEPPTPSWGIMISEAYQALRSYPYQLVGPSVALTLTTLAFNFLGDGLRDAFDPRVRGTT